MQKSFIRSRDLTDFIFSWVKSIPFPLHYCAYTQVQLTIDRIDIESVEEGKFYAYTPITNNLRPSLNISFWIPGWVSSFLTMNYWMTRRKKRHKFLFRYAKRLLHTHTEYAMSWTRDTVSVELVFSIMLHVKKRKEMPENVLMIWPPRIK